MASPKTRDIHRLTAQLTCHPCRKLVCLPLTEDGRAEGAGSSRRITPDRPSRIYGASRAYLGMNPLTSRIAARKLFTDFFRNGFVMNNQLIDLGETVVNFFLYR